MVKGKIAGIAFGGLAGYLLISKGFNLIRGCVKDICTAAEWKAYYKDKEGLHVAPGYCQYTRKIDDEHELVIEKKDSRVKTEGEESASLNGLKGSLSDAIAKAIDDWIGSRKKTEEASEGETEASEDGVVSEYDENGKPIAGRYPFGNASCDDLVFRPSQFDTAPGDPEVTNANSLKNGEDILEKSIETAREAGVPEEDILHNVKEIDAFFGDEKEDENETVD